MPKRPGIFVTFEGTEGAGKSTLIQEVAKKLRHSGYKVVLTREPGGTKVAERIRHLILGQSMNPWTELFLYEAARAEHVAQIIAPALKQGKVVLCDRFADSSLAYQGYARGLPWKAVKTLNRIATQGVEPHLTVLLDINPEVGLQRAIQKTRFEKEGVIFQKKVRRGFLKARAENPKRWLVLLVQNKTPAQLAQFVIENLGKRKIRG